MDLGSTLTSGHWAVVALYFYVISWVPNKNWISLHLKGGFSLLKALTGAKDPEPPPPSPKWTPRSPETDQSRPKMVLDGLTRTWASWFHPNLSF